MAENLTNWQKLAEIYKKIDKERGSWSNDTIEFSITVKLAEMIAKDDIAFMAVTSEPKNEGENMHVDFAVAQKEKKDYFVFFPDGETAVKMNMKFFACSTAQALEFVLKTKDIAGIQLIYDVDEKNFSYSMGEITKKMAVVAMSK